MKTRKWDKRCENEKTIVEEKRNWEKKQDEMEQTMRWDEWETSWERWDEMKTEGMRKRQEKQEKSSDKICEKSKDEMRCENEKIMSWEKWKLRRERRDKKRSKKNKNNGDLKTVGVEVSEKADEMRKDQKRQIDEKLEKKREQREVVQQDKQRQKTWEKQQDNKRWNVKTTENESR